MQQKDATNTIFQLAVDLVNDTSQHIFLTGKAGTGKTTFLRYITAHTQKNTVVVAPTGVAAINAGGVTMHSFFQLPRGAFVPGQIKRDGVIGYVEINDRHSLFKNIHFTSNKRQLLQEMELLIIDEVSMMRCDMLDAIDTILRHFRKQPHLPFGGVQVLYIGDLFQLPPVVQQEEWNILEQYYQSPFFFSAKAVVEAPPLYIELKKIYRQSEAQFIDVLNAIRNNTAIY
ncbi:MAG TPA: AAA family ATPase, partial [Flavisolibacter sp.]|nr:AAA family ATPase [Flavisolibacter sp.]